MLLSRQKFLSDVQRFIYINSTYLSVWYAYDRSNLLLNFGGFFFFWYFLLFFLSILGVWKWKIGFRPTTIINQLNKTSGMHLKTPLFSVYISGVHESPDRPCSWGSFVSQQGALWQYLYQQTPQVQWLFVINHLISGNTATKHMSTMKTTMVCMSHLKKTF